ncbi:MAG: alpha/beta hydrolase [Terriglobia bacterium]|jgi:acetyl esterase/lipase
MNRLTGIIVRIVLAVVALAVLLAVGLIVALSVSPRSFAWLLRKDFAAVGVNQVTPPIYYELRQKVRAEKDIEYPSQFKSNRLDVFIPKNATGPAATLFWVHGGGFVAGDKADIAILMTMIAARGYVVVSINYELAPETHYPSPIVQLGEAYRFLESNRHRFPTVDLHRLVIGGDSAGAQIASQFIAMQINAELARSMQLLAVLPKEDIVGAILYSGLYDLRGLYDCEN